MAATGAKRADARQPPEPRMEHCDGCQRMTASSVIKNVKSEDDGEWRALCPACQRGDDR